MNIIKYIFQKLRGLSSKKSPPSSLANATIRGVKVVFHERIFEIHAEGRSKHEKILKYLEDEGFSEHFRGKFEKRNKKENWTD